MVRRLFCISAAFAVGTLLAQYALPQTWLCPLAGGFVCLGAIPAFFLKGNTRERTLLLALGLSLSLLYNHAYMNAMRKPVELLAGTKQTAELCVTDYAEECGGDDWGEGKSHRVRVRMEEYDAYAFLYGNGEELDALEPGNRLHGEFSVTDASFIDGEAISTFTAKGVSMLLFTDEVLRVETGDEGAFRYFPVRLCRRVRETADRLYEGDTAALVRAVLTGDTGALSTESYAALSEAGILHIAAVSGLHCMFLLSMVRLLTGKRRRLTALIAILLLTLYALMVGGTPSVVRAVVMAAFMLLAPLFRRENDAPTSLGAALLILLLHNPCAVKSVGLQLSFAAVLGILTVTPRLHKVLTRRRHSAPWRFISSSISATAGALAFTLPLTALYFKRLALVTPLSNLLCLTVTSFFFALAFFSVAFGTVCLPLGTLLALPAKAAAAYLLGVCRALASLPFHSLVFEGFYMTAWLSFAYLLFFLVIFLHENAREASVSVLAVVLTLFISCTFTAKNLRSGALNIYQLDVGQGAGTLAVTEDATALFDCGSGNTFIHAARSAINSLTACGATHLDYLVLTHYHTDHTDGLPELFAVFRVDTVLLPRFETGDTLGERVVSLAKAHDAEIRYIEENTEVRLSENVKFQIFPPGEENADRENESGLSALIQSGDFDFLLTGDMNGKSEKDLAGRVSLPDTEVVLLGHHGSKNSADKAFLEQISPEVGIISVGKNSYGHPSREAMLRLSAVGARLYRTDRHGTVRIQVR